MSVTVTIPTTSDYRQATFASGEADQIVYWILAGDYLYGLTDSNPAKIIRVNKADFSDRTSATFASDNQHGNASGLKYVPSKDRLYALLGGGGDFVVSEIHPTTLARTDVITPTSALTGASVDALDADGVNLYILCTEAGQHKLKRCPLASLSAANLVTTNLNAYDAGDTLHYSAGRIYVMGGVSSGIPNLIKIETTGFTVESVTPFPDNVTADGPQFITSAGGRVFATCGDLFNTVWAFDKITMAATTITHPHPASHGALISDGQFVWDSTIDGHAVRIDPGTLDLRTYTLDAGYVSELAAGDGYLYTVLYSSPTSIARYGINPRPGTVQWVQTVGGGVTDYGNGVAADKDGNVLFTGNAGGYIFLNKYSPFGSVIWSKSLGTGAGYSVVAEEVTGNIYLAGYFSGAGALGGAIIPGLGFSDIFVAKYLPDGTHVWSKGFVGAGEDSARSICIAPDGDLLVTGFFEGLTDFGGIQLSSAGGNDVFLCKVRSSDGVVLWAKRWGDAQDAKNDFGTSVATDLAGNIFLGGQFGNTVDFGCGNLVSSGLDGFITKRDSAGDCTWSKRIGGTLADQVSGVATFPNGDVVAIGSFMNSFDFGLGTVTSSGKRDIFVVKYSADGSVVRWVKTFGGAFQLDDQGTAVTVDRNDNVTITGRATGDTDFGGGVITMGPLDVFVVKFDSNGTYLWGTSFGSWSLDHGLSVAADPFGNILVSGQFYGEVDFGGIVKTHVGAGDAFVLKLGA